MIRLLLNVVVFFTSLCLQTAVAMADDIPTSKSDNPKRLTHQTLGTAIKKSETDSGELSTQSLYDPSKVISPLGKGPLSISASFYDLKYPSEYSPPAQHLGIDLHAPEGTSVFSPVTGRVLVNRTNLKDAFDKYLVIKDESNGNEHVLGHINSDLREGQNIAIGMTIGQIVKAGTGAHVHWGINKNSVNQAMTENWGWGRAPVSSTKQDAENKGWLDPEIFLIGAKQSNLDPNQSTTTALPPTQRAEPILYEFKEKPLDGLFGDLFGVPKKQFYLPPDSKPLEKNKCDRSLVGRIVNAKFKDVQDWYCQGYFNHKETAIVLAEKEQLGNVYRNPTWRFRVIAVGSQVTDLGKIEATNGLVPIIFNDGTIEILGISLNGWSGNINDPPYSRYRLEMDPNGHRLAMSLVSSEKSIGSSGKQVAVSNVSKSSGLQSTSARVDQDNRNVSDEFYVNQMEAIAKYSKWTTAPFTLSSVSFSDGKIYAEYSELPTTIAMQHEERMQNMKNGNNVWNNFYGATQNSPFASQWKLTCEFPLSQAEQLSKIPKDKSINIQLKLLSARDKYLVFDCKI
uniref:M23ase beta-sheet core domain-containing protein n=1 Tax=Candidatus Nitrotoga fabula TaxID=2182327 RepID=A0A2X0QXE5_9PROT|nr:exported protein of unknown function [Candidatus Nitrotoga fabula]